MATATNQQQNAIAAAKDELRHEVAFWARVATDAKRAADRREAEITRHAFFQALTLVTKHLPNPVSTDDEGYGIPDPAGEDYIVEDGPKLRAADRAAIDEDRA